MKKLIVNADSYAYFSYLVFINRRVNISKPDCLIFEVGEIVAVSGGDGLEIGVIIGGIDESYGEVRTNTSGTVSMSTIRSAKQEDFFPTIWFDLKLFEECQNVNPVRCTFQNTGDINRLK